MVQEYDVMLNDLGYHLAKGPDGKLLSGAAHAQHSDPFANYFSDQERWKRADLALGGGAGAKKFSGGDRYQWAANLDTRSGDAIWGPGWEYCDGGNTVTAGVAQDPTDEFLNSTCQFVKTAVAVTDKEISTGGVDGWAVKFRADDNGFVRNVHILVKRDEDTDYSGATGIKVEIQGDTGTVPDKAAAASATVGLEVTADEWLPMEDLWRRGEYFWLHVDFGGDTSRAQMANGTWYWLCVLNANATPVYWGKDALVTSADQAEWDGANWAAKTGEGNVFAKVKLDVDIDAQVRKFCPFRGGDDIERLYAAVGPKVMYYDEPTSEWLNSTVPGPAGAGITNLTHNVMDMIVFGPIMIICQGDGNNLYWFSGVDATTVWTEISGKEAQCLALHDNLLWKADVAAVSGSADGKAWPGQDIHIGDPGMPVIAMTSHGGKLYCAKPEGIYELTYPDGYPDTGEPTSNMVLDFRTERAPRAWLLDWHSGLYFPGTGGIYEWKSSILSDIWADAIDDEADQWPGQIAGNRGYWQAVAGSTRGLVLVMASPFLSNNPHVIRYKSGEFHPLILDKYEAEQVMATFVQSLGGGRGRLWYGHGTDIAVAHWPTWTDNRELQSEDDFFYYAYERGANSFLRFPLFEGDRPEQMKDWHEVRVRTRNAGTTNAKGGVVDVYYRYEDDEYWHPLGTIDTSPYQTLEFDLGTSSYYLDLSLVFKKSSASHAPTGTVRVEQVQLIYQPLPDSISTFQLYIQARTEAPLHHGAVNQRDAGAQYTELVALIEDEDEPFTYIDVLGNSHEVRVLGLTINGLKQVKGDGPQGYDVEATFVVSLLKIADDPPGTIAAGQVILGAGVA